ncbi:MAG: putative 1-acyl-sn-glycerol-3-phosphate acyltransferase [Chlamydiota bacterium]|jgi:1-acyl-sn-glycerol-3-phosphate acyltransferase
MKPAWARRSKGMTLLYRLVVFVVWCFFKIFYRHKVYGLRHFKKGSAIIAANHSSFYDPPVLAVSSPEEVHFLARQGLFKNPLFGWLIRSLNSHPVKGSAADITVFKTIHQLLLEGEKVVLFPEGARGDTPHLSALKPGIALLIARAESTVIPTYIHGTFAIFNRFCRFPKLSGKTACVFGSPIPWSDFAHLDKKEAQQALLQKLTLSIQNLEAWYREGAKGSPP